MKACARVKNLHISYRKANLVCSLIRNKKVNQALTILQNTNKKTARYLQKLLASAIANAINNHAMDADKLYVYEAIVGQARTIKRAMPRAKGSSNMIKKRHCHLTIWLSDDVNQRQLDLREIKNRKKVNKNNKNSQKKNDKSQKVGK